MKKIFIVLFIFIFFASIIYSQEKWSTDPRKISKPKSNIKAPRPVTNNYINPNITTKYYFTPYGIFSVSPNFRVLPNGNQQNEVILVRHPSNPLIMFGSANTTSSIAYSQGVYVTTNGGLNWSGSDVLGGLTNSFSNPGPVIDKNGVFILTTINTDNPLVDTLQVYTSVNNGQNWSGPVNLSSAYADKNFANTDDVPSSTFYGRSYCVWSNFGSAQPPIVISYTLNSGASWTAMSTINNPPAGHYAHGADVIVGPQGQVYVCWAAATMTSPYTEDFLGFAKSLNGGISWTVNENAYDMNGIRGTLFPTAVRVNGFPRIGVDKSGGPRNEWIYIVTGEKNLAPAGNDPDIILHRSSDQGNSWSPGIRVNQDALNNGKVQFFPAINVDEYGGISIVYYDNRNCASDSCEVYISRSTNGGDNWTDILVSDARWKPKSEFGFPGYMGDYIGITSGNNKLWPFWFDDRTGIFQVWTASLDLGPYITHTSLNSTELTLGPRAIDCIIIPAGSAIDPSKTKLFYSRNNPVFTDSIPMSNTSGNNWTTTLPLTGQGLYRYYLKTADLLNRPATAPGGAPYNYYSFTAMPDTVKPVIAHTPFQDLPRNQWPLTVNTSVTDNIGVDSVWVKWYRNNPSNGINRFNLPNTGGSIYSGAFNSDTNQVIFNDSIYYRIFARDNSSNHNVDSTSLFTFKLTALAISCIGAGSLSVGYPFYTFYMDSRTDMLFLANEIKAGTGSAGVIQKIGFLINSASPQAMNGFTIKMQMTSLTSISGFTSSGWTTVYSGTYTIPGAGGQNITLQTPFTWDGTSNLLIEICFNNSSYSMNSMISATAASGKVVHNHDDLLAGNGCTDITTAGTGYTARPNLCFVISLSSVGIKQIETIIPTSYNLFQNYPNPFNPVTQIKFDIAKTGDRGQNSEVKLKIYDITGKEVATLVNESLQPGTYQVTFDGTNLSSGVYFYKLEVNDFVNVKKMILVK
jgi:hypothetical protein